MVAQLPAEVIREDRDLEQSMESASEALAHLRWHWTLDESNPERVSLRAYGRAVGRHHATVRSFAAGYAHWIARSGEDHHHLQTFIAQANMATDRRIVVEAVAEAHDISVNSASALRRPELKEVRNAVIDEAEKREERGLDFSAEERQDYARKVAEQKRIAREREERERIERQHKQGAQFIQADAHLSKARRELREALGLVQETEFSEEEVELLTREQAAIQGILGLIGSALQGDSGTDWDAELAALENRRQNG